MYIEIFPIFNLHLVILYEFLGLNKRRVEYYCPLLDFKMIITTWVFIEKSF